MQEREKEEGEDAVSSYHDAATTGEGLTRPSSLSDLKGPWLAPRPFPPPPPTPTSSTSSL